MQMGIIEVFICRHLHMNTSTILICIWLICRLDCATLHTKCCGAVKHMPCKTQLPASPECLCMVQLLIVNGTPLQMQVDTGAVVSLISESTYKRVWRRLRRPALKKIGILLRTYTGESINVVGKIRVDVQYGDQYHCSLNLLVVHGRGPSLIGQDWLSELKMNLSLFNVGSSDGVEQLLEKHARLFEGKLGLLEGI